MEPWMLELVKTIEAEDKGKLEEAYGVEFDSDSIPLCCRIISSFSDDFGDATNHDKERQRPLKEDIVRVLDAACRRVISNLLKVVEKDGLDLEYLLHRTCVELAAIRKEKERRCSELWKHRVTKEYNDLIDTWHKLEKEWKPLLLSQSETRAEELGIFKQTHEELVSYLQDGKTAVEEGEVSSRTRMFQQLNVLRARIELSINKELKQILTVGQDEIVAAAREILRVPALWRNKFFNPNYHDLETTLASRVSGQDHAIRAIASALSDSDSETRSGKGPVRSFLFICSSNTGGEELTKALAEQLFHDEQRVVEFDLEKNTQDDSVMELDVRQIKEGLFEYTEVRRKECGFRGDLIDAVKKTPGTVIMLRNVEKAHACVTEFLLEILRNGKVEDWKGKMVDFTRTLFIMTSDESHVYYYEMGRHWKCDCALMPGKLFLMEEKKVRHRNCYLPILKKAKQLFKPELLDIIDNMIVFRLLVYPDLRSFTRLQLRILANSIGRGRIIVYPSEALLDNISPRPGEGYKEIKPAVERDIVPKLLEIYSQSRNVRSIVYIDTLVGTTGLSFRVETGGRFAGDEEFDQFLAYDVCQFWNIYQTQILWLRAINGLRKALGLSMDADGVKISAHLQHLDYKIRNLLTNSQSRSLEMMVLSSSAKLGGSDRQLKKRDTKEIDELRKRLFTGSETQHYVFSTVAKAILGWATSNSHAMPMTALLLGLAAAGKANLRRDLAKLVDDENNRTTKTKLLLQINLSDCSDYDKFFKLIYDGHNQHSFGYPERVGMRPGSILLIDQVENAPMSVFSGLISLLDHRMLTDINRECIIDLSDTVIIIVSDLRNKDLIAGMFEQESEREKKFKTLSDDFIRSQHRQQPWEEYKKTVTIQQQRSRFRSELLNRVDEIVFFNPCVGEQLNNFARLSMTEGPHLTDSRAGWLTTALRDLFDESNYKCIPALLWRAAYSEQLLSEGLLHQNQTSS